MISKMAWKNIWRNKVRSSIIILALAFGLLGGTFSSAVMKGSGEQRVREAVNRETSHLQIHNPDYLSDNEIRFDIGKQMDKLANVLDTLKEVRAWSPRIKFEAMAGSAIASAGVMVTGMDPAREMLVTEIYSLINDSSGNWFQNGKDNTIVIGQALAKKLQVHLHSKIVLTFQDINGNLTGAAFKICGIYHTSNSLFDEMNIFVQRKDLLPLINAGENFNHEIAIKLKDPEKVGQVEKFLKNQFPELSVQNWKEIDPVLGMINDLMDLMLYLFMGIILLALGFGIVNTMQMSILERRREFGMLTAVGMNKRRVFFLIMMESVFLSLTGGLGGMILGLLLTLYTRHTGIDLSIFSQGFEKIGYSSVLYPSLNILFFIILTIMVIMTGIIASVFPTLHALRLKPAEAIRSE